MKYILLIALVIFSSCKINRELVIVNGLQSCLSKEDINILKKDKKNKNERKLIITEVQFNFGECVGLFSYGYFLEFAEEINYVLKSKDHLYFQSKNIEKNKKVLDAFMQTYGNYFSDAEKKYIESIFIENGVPNGFNGLMR